MCMFERSRWTKRESACENCQRIQENDCAKKFCCSSSDISMIPELLRLEPEKNLGKLHPSRHNKQIREFKTQKRSVTGV